MASFREHNQTERTLASPSLYVGVGNRSKAPQKLRRDHSNPRSCKLLYGPDIVARSGVTQSHQQLSTLESQVNASGDTSCRPRTVNRAERHRVTLD
jgi:hypothetical protein